MAAEVRRKAQEERAIDAEIAAVHEWVQEHVEDTDWETLAERLMQLYEKYPMRRPAQNPLYRGGGGHQDWGWDMYQPVGGVLGQFQHWVGCEQHRAEACNHNNPDRVRNSQRYIREAFGIEFSISNIWGFVVAMI